MEKEIAPYIDIEAHSKDNLEQHKEEKQDEPEFNRLHAVEDLLAQITPEVIHAKASDTVYSLFGLVEKYPDLRYYNDANHYLTDFNQQNSYQETHVGVVLDFISSCIL